MALMCDDAHLLMATSNQPASFNHTAKKQNDV